MHADKWTDGRTDGRTDVTKLFATYTNASKNAADVRGKEFGLVILTYFDFRFRPTEVRDSK